MPQFSIFLVLLIFLFFEVFSAKIWKRWKNLFLNFDQIVVKFKNLGNFQKIQKRNVILDWNLDCPKKALKINKNFKFWHNCPKMFQIWLQAKSKTLPFVVFFNKSHVKLQNWLHHINFLSSAFSFILHENLSLKKLCSYSLKTMYRLFSHIFVGFFVRFCHCLNFQLFLFCRSKLFNSIYGWTTWCYFQFFSDTLQIQKF